MLGQRVRTHMCTYGVRAVRPTTTSFPRGEVEIFPFPHPGEPPVIFPLSKCFCSLVLR